MNIDKQIYFVGGGIASLAGAAYLIRDCNFPGKNIHIIEEINVLGGSNDAGGNPKNGYAIRGGRILNNETCENMWDLFKTIPSIDDPSKSVRQEIVEFNSHHHTHANARLINNNAEVLDVMSMGFSLQDRLCIVKLISLSEAELGKRKISDWFSDHFFKTNFWYLWCTTFGFQSWHSVVEFRRYILRFAHEFPRIQTLEGVIRTPYNQYESLILPLKRYLEKYQVNFKMESTVTDLDFKHSDDITVTAIHYVNNGFEYVITLNEGDLVIVTNGSMTDSSSFGSMNKAPNFNTEGSSWRLWNKIANKKRGLGNPSVFDTNPKESNWESFTITCSDSELLDMIVKFSRNKPGTGALMTFKESSWLISIVIPYQPYFKNQPENVKVFWGYGLYTDKVGDYVKKKMKDCTGKEITIELLNHLKFQDNISSIIKTVNCIPCMMPYVTAEFMPRCIGDRPAVVPKNSTNLAFASQFCEIPKDIVFTEEYSIRAARIAVYTLLGIDKEIEPVKEYQYDIRTLFQDIVASFR